jgi:ATP-dependent DNA helicase RecQ
MTTASDTRATAQHLLTRLAGPAAELRDDQWEAIAALLDGRTVEVVQRTGWGKSAVYWLATALLRRAGRGPTLVISPLLALMRDQVAAAGRAGLRAVTLNSANIDDWSAIEEQVRADEVDVLLISPERLNSGGFRARVLPDLAPRIGLLVVDEAHCLSDWGHDFRPDYRRLRSVLERLPDGTAVLATTATANERVSRDVATQLGSGTLTLRGSLDRESLALSVVPTPDLATAYAWIADALHDGALAGSGIVYTLTVDETAQLAQFLRGEGLAVAAYSSATPPEERIALESALLRHELSALVATSSLGMGLDMPDLGFVVHLGAPASPIAYYQQVGRAGRAIDSAKAVLLPTTAQERIWSYFDSTAFPAEDRVHKVLALLADGPMSISRLEVESGLRRGRLEALLKVLDVDGAVERVDGGWRATGRPWTYDRERYEGVAAARKREQDVMRAYQKAEGCLMRVLRSELDDPGAVDCGRCSVCRGEAPTMPGPARVRAASGHLRSQPVHLEPRKMWPAGAGRRGRIGAAARAEPGLALARGDDAGWYAAVAQALAADRPVSDEILDAVVQVFARWGWPAGRPTWITWVPSRRRDTLLVDLARRLAAKGRWSVAQPLRADGSGRQADAATNAEAASRALGRLSVGGPVDPAPLLLLDDSTRSGFTLTVAATLLREAGAGPVYPFALLKEF